MIFTSKEYALLIEAFNIHYSHDINKKTRVRVKLEEFAYNQGGIVKTSDWKSEAELIDNNFKKFKEKDILPSKIEAKRGDYFYQLDKKIFATIQNHFMKNGIDLLNVMQKRVISKIKIVNSRYAENKELGLYNQYMNQVLLYDYKYDETPEKIQLFCNMIAQLISVSMNTKVYQQKILKLIKHELIRNEDNNHIVKYFALLIKNVPSIHTDAQEEYEWIKNHIKDWDLSQYFTRSEKNLLYATNKGVTKTKITGYYFKFDLDIIKHNNNKMSLTIMRSNINMLLECFTEKLITYPEYLKTNFIANDRILELSLMFDVALKPKKLDSIENIIEAVIYSEEKLSKLETNSIVNKILLTETLNEQLKANEVVVRRNKI